MYYININTKNEKRIENMKRSMIQYETSLIVAMKIDINFQLYKSGYYWFQDNDNFKYHAVEIIGWG